MKRTIGVTVATLVVGTTLIGCGVEKGQHSVATNGTNITADVAKTTQIGGTDTLSTNGSKAASTAGKQKTGDANGQSSSNANQSSNQTNTAESNESSDTSSTDPANTTNSTNSSNATPTTPATSKSGVELSVTLNFGSQALFGKRLAYNDGDAVMDVLDANLNVDTAYGGGFVSSINGVKSGYTGNHSSKAKKDWFFWVNGSIAATGANDYMLKQGDDVWWDYHSWDGSTGIPVVIGQYPHPFTTGYSGVAKKTTIYYGDGEQGLAQQLQTALQKQGAATVDCNPYSDQAIGSHSANVIVIGINSDLLKYAELQNITNGGVKHGEYIQLSAQSYSTLHENGTVAGTFGSGNGAIMAVGSGSGDTAPVWFVTGVDQSGLHAAVSTLTEHPSSIYHMISSIVSKDGVRNIPDNA